MSVPVKKLLANANNTLREKIFSMTLNDIAFTMQNGEAWLNHFVCMWKQSVSTHLPSKYSFLFSVNKKSQFLDEITLQDVVNSFRSEYKFFCACVNWEKKKYWHDQKTGHVCLLEWLEKRGLTIQDTLLVYPSRQSILAAVHGGPGIKKLRKKLEQEVAWLLARKVSARRIIKFFEGSESFEELRLKNKVKK